MLSRQPEMRTYALKRLEPPTTSITDRIAPNFRVTAATCSREQLICADRRPAASTSLRVDGITPATMLQSGSNWTTHSISQGEIDAVTSRRTTLSDVRWRNIEVTVSWGLKKTFSPQIGREGDERHHES